VDAAILGYGQAPVFTLKHRVRLARAMGENGRAVSLIGEALRDSRDDRSAVLALAEEQIQEQPDPALARLLHEALLARLPEAVAGGSERTLIEADARRLEHDGDFGSAEAMWRSLLSAPAADSGRSVLELALGNNLAAQHRWEEARFFLEPLTAVDKWQVEPTLRFQLAEVERGRGDLDAARRWAREGLALLPGEGPVRPAPGLGTALRLLDGDPHSGGPADAVLERVRLALDPEGLVPALHDRVTLLALLEGLERRSAKPQPLATADCGGPWSAVGEDPATRGMALLQAAGGLRMEDAQRCLKEALRILEKAFPGEDPRLMLPLLRLGRCLQDREDAGAEAVFRRILGLAAANPDADPLLALEVRARLGQLLNEQGRDEEADRLLQDALDGLMAVPAADPKVLEMLGGVVLMRVARLEYREDYLAAAQVLEQVEGLLVRDSDTEAKIATELRELTGPKIQFHRRAQLQILLRAQGLP
jgi:tetratricopeptide (TPR) repeat protein